MFSTEGGGKVPGVPTESESPAKPRHGRSSDFLQGLPPHEIGVLPRYLTTKNPSPPEVTTTLPDLKNG